jgi:cytochrome P450
LGNGIVFSDGYAWKNKRKIISKAFNFELLQENIPKIADICEDCFEQFDQIGKIDKSNVKYDICKLTILTLNRIMLACFFGSDKVETKVHGKNFDEFIVKVMEDATMITVSPLILLFGMLPYNLGLTKRIRGVKESIAILHEIAR